jgi:hypothetical protein
MNSECFFYPYTNCSVSDAQDSYEYFYDHHDGAVNFAKPPGHQNIDKDPIVWTDKNAVFVFHRKSEGSTLFHQNL